MLAKLLALTFALAFAPLTFYYLSRDYVWSGERSRDETSLPNLTWYTGNSTFAAITAVLAANIVLAVYIILSIREERQEVSKTKTEKPETKKTQ